jgi:dihydrofolate synthase/folylpolyglutamate synthase
MKQLGNTLAAIAREKAGIIKPGVPVICGVTQPEPQSVVADIAREHGCRLVQLGCDFQYHYVSPMQRNQEDLGIWPWFSPRDILGAIDFALDAPGQEMAILDVPLAMRGAHQASNAAVALATVAELRHQGWCVSTDAIRLGLSGARLAGRVEVVPGEPTVVLDTAHNPASACALIEALAEMPRSSRQSLILSTSHDKDVPAIVAELAPHFDRFIVTKYQDNPRAVAAEELAAIVRQAVNNATVEVRVSTTPLEAWLHVCQTAMPLERVCITGSFYLAAEMRRLVLMSPAAKAGS